MTLYIGGYHWNRNAEGFAIKPQYVKKTKTLQCTFGFELEITGGGCNANNGSRILAAFGFEQEPLTNYVAAKDYMLWATKDCSIGENYDSGGIEWVTQPMSYEYHMTKMKWKEAFAEMEELGYKSWDGGKCGLHCHIPRSYLVSNTSNPEEVLTILFVNNVAQLKRFSGRYNPIESDDGFHYCLPFDTNYKFWSHKFKSGDQPDELERLSNTKEQADSAAYNGSRYHMVNFSNEDTIEFRLFRGTLNYKTFVADLQLCYILAEIAKRFSIEEVCNVNWAFIRQFAKGLGFKEFLQVDSFRR